MIPLTTAMLKSFPEEASSGITLHRHSSKMHFVHFNISLDGVLFHPHKYINKRSKFICSGALALSCLRLYSLSALSSGSHPSLFTFISLFLSLSLSRIPLSPSNSFLYSELIKHWESPAEDNIFQVAEDGLLKVKDDITFHLYIRYLMH